MQKSQDDLFVEEKGMMISHSYIEPRSLSSYKQLLMYVKHVEEARHKTLCLFNMSSICQYDI